MSKFMMLPHIQCGFDTEQTKEQIKKFPNYKSYSVVSFETLSDRGLIVNIKTANFNGFIFVSFDFNNNYVIRKVTTGGFVMLMNRIKNIEDLSIIFDLYLVD